MSHVGQYRPFSSLSFQVKVLYTFQGVSSLLRSGLRNDNAYRFSLSGDGPQNNPFLCSDYAYLYDGNDYLHNDEAYILLTMQEEEFESF